MKQCSMCKQMTDEFNGRDTRCKSCVADYTRYYRYCKKDTPTEVQARYIKDYELHTYTGQWKQVRETYYRQQGAELQLAEDVVIKPKPKRIPRELLPKTNPELRKCVRRLRTVVSRAFPNGYKDYSYAWVLLGASWSTVKEHIESQFTDGMTWDNYGSEWEVDHIEELYTATSEQHVIELSHYTNLRPLGITENRTRYYM